MAVKFIDDSGDCGTDAMAIEAIDYAASFGVPIINASWGGSRTATRLDNAIDESECPVRGSRGNARAQHRQRRLRFYPAEFDRSPTS